MPLWHMGYKIWGQISRIYFLTAQVNWVVHYHHHFRLAPLWVRSATRNQQPPERAILSHIASVNVRLWDSRSFRTVFIHVIWGWLDNLFQSSDGSAVRIFLAPALSSNSAMCPNTERVDTLEFYNLAKVIAVNKGQSSRFGQEKCPKNSHVV